MNTTKKTILLSGLLTASTFATDRATIGLGVNIVSPNGITVQTRIAPEIKMPVSLYFSSRSSIINDEGETQDNSSYGLAVAPQFVFASSEDIEASAGLQLGIQASGISGTFDNAPEDSDASFAIGPILGLEYYFTKNFSMAGNFALTYTKEFEDKHDNDFGGSTLNTGSGVIFSWYFQ